MDEKFIAERKAGYLPRNYRIISHRTQKRILHIEDVLEIEQIRFEIWDYSRGAGAKANVEAYLDVHTARLLAAELAAGRLKEMDGHRTMGGGYKDGQAVSRILITESAETRNPIRLTITNGPGVVQEGGLITPSKGARQETLSVLLSTFDARRIGMAVLHHLQAWATHTYKARIAAGSWQPEATEVPQTQGEGRSEPRNATTPGQRRPSTPSGEPAPEANPSTLPRYANGETVSSNPAELQAFSAYVGALGRVPADVDGLRAWVRAEGA